MYRLYQLMADHARSDDPAVQAQLDRLAALSPGRDTLGLERITALLARLGNPHHRLPPVFHVAGTNGKGSTCAVLRAALEGDGKAVHVYSSPHLVRFNERIRLAGRLISDAQLADYLARVLDIADGLDASFFEVTTAAAFLAFAEHPADACVIEVGLGGRLDATNVIAHPAVCGIAQLGIDHEAFLGDDAAGIAREKAGIARYGRPLVTLAYPLEIREAVAGVATAAGAKVLAEGRDWHFARIGEGLKVVLPGRTIEADKPSLPGIHQYANAALAIAMLSLQTILPVGRQALIEAPAKARWPARLQRLGAGPFTALLGDGATVWLDGGHNANAGEALAAAFPADASLHIVCGMLGNKDAISFLRPFASRIASFHAVPVHGHEHHGPMDLCWSVQDALGVALADPAVDTFAAIKHIAAIDSAPTILICGSLYLAGEVLRANNELPD